MSKPFIVVSDGMDKNVFNELSKHPGLEVYPKSKLKAEELNELLPRVNGLIIRSATAPDKKMIDAAPNLKYIIRAGEGTDNIDKAYCFDKGVKVSNTPGANNNSAAEHALALMMTVLRYTAHANQSMHNGKWEKTAFEGNELWKKKVGIVGFGRIGQLLCKRLQGFEPSVLFYDPFVEKSPFDYAIKAKNLEEIFEKSDIVSIHMPLLDSTKNLIGKDLLEKMPAHSILVNAARGKIVDEKALYDVLKNKKIRGAGFDVFAEEPLNTNSPLFELENLVMTPHLGGSTGEAQLRVGEMAKDQMIAFFVNNQLLNSVTK